LRCCPRGGGAPEEIRPDAAGAVSPDTVDALVLAGGRCSGLFAGMAGSPVKAMAAVGGTPLLLRVVNALRMTGGVRSICVVGPDPVREILDPSVLWVPESGSALQNVRAGIESLDAGPFRLLIVPCDLAAIESAALEDFLHRAP